MKYKDNIFAIVVAVLATLFGVSGWEILGDEDGVVVESVKVAEIEDVGVVGFAEEYELTYRVEGDILIYRKGRIRNEFAEKPLPYRLERVIKVKSKKSLSRSEILDMINLPEEYEAFFEVKYYPADLEITVEGLPDEIEQVPEVE